VKVTGVEVFPVHIPMKIPFATSLGALPPKAKRVIVILRTDEGLAGVGEAAPDPSYHDETMEGIVDTLREYMVPVIVGEDPSDIERIHEKVRRVIVGNTFALSALDFALYDVIGRRTGLPVCRLLGGLFREKVPVVWVLSLATRLEDMAGEAEAMAGKGFKTLKIKVGVDPRLDVERVKAVREAVGDRAEIRVDANQGWTVDKAISTIRRMERYELQLVEQPVAGWDLKGMARVAKAVDTPVMADESVFTPETALKVVEMEAADIINIKVMKPGGLHNSKKVAAIAEAAGIPCLVGSMLETGVGTAAGVHFAAAHHIVSYPCETIGPLYFGDDVVEEPVKTEGGYVYVPQKPGLGVQLSLEKLRRLSKP